MRRPLSALSLLSVLAGCPEVIVAGPKETGYGEAPAAAEPDASEPDVIEPEPDAAIEVVDASEPPPASEVEDAGNAMPTDAGTPRTPATSLALATTTEPHLTDEPAFNLRRPTEMAKLEGPRPVIVWANEGCQRNDDAARTLFERWAAGGFVVLSLAAPTGGGLLDLLASLQTTTQADHAALVDWVVAQNERGPYAGQLDVGRIMVAGDACGGRTALQVAASDDRVAGAFVSGSLGSVGAGVLRELAVPVAVADRAAYTALPGPALLVQRRQGNDEAEEAELALTWMELVLYGTPQAFEALSSERVCERCTPGAWTLESKGLETLRK
ncbi:MAG: hypothetical protein ABW352_22160 [Polyangiales bacterium]